VAQSDAEAGGLHSLSSVMLPQAELTLAYLALLARLLAKRGLHCHTLALHQLARLVAKLVLKSEHTFVSTSLRLVEALDELGEALGQGRGTACPQQQRQ
jgi:hypothetical protein